MIQPNRAITAGLALTGLGLVGWSAYRAATFPFTHDESLTFAMFTGDQFWQANSNNHLLNTILMRMCAWLFGTSELSLRLPNVLAHGMYVTFTLLLLSRLRHAAWRVAGFVLLNLNLFVLDFFAVARGYGLGLACITASLYWLIRGCELRQAESTRFDSMLYLSVAAGWLATLANLVAVYYVVPLVLVTTWLLLTGASGLEPNGRRRQATTTMLALSGIVMAYVAFQIVRLEMVGQLYVGGGDGFFADTIRSLVTCSLYGIPQTAGLAGSMAAMVAASSIALAVLASGIGLVRREVTPLGVCVLLLAGAVLLPMGFHAVRGTLYPIERTALLYVPLYGVTLLFGLDAAAHLMKDPRRRAIALAPGVALAMGGMALFVRGADARTLYTWPYDRHDREVIELVEQDHRQTASGGTLTFGVSWQLQPSISFYRFTRGDLWLAPVTRRPIDFASDDYIYAFRTDVDGRTTDRHVTVVEFSDVGTVLLRAVR